MNTIFFDYLQKIKHHFYTEKKDKIEKNFRNMLFLGTNDEKLLDAEALEVAKSTFTELETKFGYDRNSALKCLKFYLANIPK